MKAILALLTVLFPLHFAAAQIVHVWDLADSDQPGQLTIYNPDLDDAQFGVPIRSGDLNGDGFDDYVVSAMAGDGPQGKPRENAGEVAIYFSPGHFEGPVDLAGNPENVVTVYGEAEHDIFGIKSEVADVDGDGVNDLLVGAFYADGPSGRDAGKLYLISGHVLTDLRAAGADLDLGQRPWPGGVSVFHGPEPRGRLGAWMAAGDVNGDGRVDVLVGADQASGRNAKTPDQRGQVFVLPGPPPAVTSVDLSIPYAGVSIAYGVDPQDHFGSTVACADIDGDGYGDIIAGAGAFGTARNAYERTGGAGDGPENDRPNAGELYVVFGGPALPPQIDLATSLGDAMVMYGADGGGASPDRLGEEIVPADVNGDGITDLLVGAYRADGPRNSRFDGGEAYVVFGAPDLRGRVIDMATRPEDVVVIYGSTAQAIAGDAIAAGDIHGDGFDDLFIGVPGDAGPLNRPLSGGIAIIAGGPSLPHEIDLAAPNVPVVWIQAPDVADFSAYWAAAGDLDGDGHVDVMPNGMAGDGPTNNRINAGEAHAVSGARLARYLAGRSTPVETPVETPVGREETTLEDLLDLFGAFNQDTTSVAAGKETIPAQFSLGAVYPNPFNSTATIPFALDRPSAVRLSIHDLAGQLVATLISGERAAGEHLGRWNGLNAGGQRAASGMYVARLTVGARTRSAKLLLLR